MAQLKSTTVESIKPINFKCNSNKCFPNSNNVLTIKNRLQKEKK